jgi:Fic family protein
MKPEDYRESMAGRLAQQGEGALAYWAFVPNPLPPRLELDLELVRLLSEADRALGELAGLGRALENPQLLIRPLMHREAVLSSAIEGTQTDINGLYAFEAEQLALPGIESLERNSDAHEVLNYVRALEYGIERVKSLPVSLRLVRELHDKLMNGVRGDSATPGEFRTRQNWIGRPGSVLNEANYVPPPVAEMKTALADLELFLHTADEPYPPLVRLAFVHYQFEAIHPFVDGNGRIGRLLLALLLVEWGLLPLPLLYLSGYFETDRRAYYDGLTSVSQRGAWKDWVAYFLVGVRDQSRDAVSRLRKLLELREAWRRQLSTAKASASALLLVDELFKSPILTIAEATRRLAPMTGPGVRKVVQKLVAANILVREPNTSYNVTYFAPDILSIIK